MTTKDDDKEMLWCWEGEVEKKKKKKREDWVYIEKGGERVSKQRPKKEEGKSEPERRESAPASCDDNYRAKKARAGTRAAEKTNTEINDKSEMTLTW